MRAALLSLSLLACARPLLVEVHAVKLHAAIGQSTPLIKMSADRAGAVVATSYADNTAAVWDTRSGRAFTIEGDGSLLVDVSPDGKHLAAVKQLEPGWAKVGILDPDQPGRSSGFELERLPIDAGVVFVGDGTLLTEELEGEGAVRLVRRRLDDGSVVVRGDLRARSSAVTPTVSPDLAWIGITDGEGVHLIRTADLTEQAWLGVPADARFDVRGRLVSAIQSGKAVLAWDPRRAGDAAAASPPRKVSLVTVEVPADPGERAAVVAEIEAEVAGLQAGTRSWAALVARNGGQDVAEWFERGTLRPDLEALAWATGPGEIGGPILLDDVIAFLRVVEIGAAGGPLDPGPYDVVWEPDHGTIVQFSVSSSGEVGAAVLDDATAVLIDLADDTAEMVGTLPPGAGLAPLGDGTRGLVWVSTTAADLVEVRGGLRTVARLGGHGLAAHLEVRGERLFQSAVGGPAHVWDLALGRPIGSAPERVVAFGPLSRVHPAGDGSGVLIQPRNTDTPEVTLARVSVDGIGAGDGCVVPGRPTSSVADDDGRWVAWLTGDAVARWRVDGCSRDWQVVLAQPDPGAAMPSIPGAWWARFNGDTRHLVRLPDGIGVVDPRVGLQVLDVETGDLVREEADVIGAFTLADGRVLTLRGQVLEWPGGSVVHGLDGPFQVQADPAGHTAMVIGGGGFLLIDLASAEIVHRIAEPAFAGAVLPDGRHYVVAGAVGASIGEVDSGKYVAGLYAFRDGTWAVVDPVGRYDASFGGDLPYLWWTFDTSGGYEYVALEQLKERYYEPGLLAKILGTNPEPVRNVGALHTPSLPPRVVVVSEPTPERPVLKVRVEDRGGGIGPVSVYLNGKEHSADARPRGTRPGRRAIELVLDLSRSPLLRTGPGARNEVDVTAHNAEGWLSSRSVPVLLSVPGDAPLVTPSLFAVVAGVSDYAGDELDLRFAARDATDFAAALIAGNASEDRLFDAVQVWLHTTSDDAPVQELPGSVTLVRGDADREAILASLDAVRDAARPEDVVVLYLAGHGVADKEEFLYLTRAARSADLSDPEVRRRAALSGSDLVERLRAMPAGKQVLILDTCHSGTAVAQFGKQRALPSAQVRAVERMKDRTGLFVLAGSAADAVSYESGRFGQGLLTWALLDGMRGAALREGRFWDVDTLLRHAADLVPVLARGISGIQRPVTSMPWGGGSFDIGEVDATTAAAIPLALERPVLVQPIAQSDDTLGDELGLRALLAEALRDRTDGADARLVYVDALAYPGAVVLAARYGRADAGRVRVEARLVAGDEVRAQTRREVDADALHDLAIDLAAWAEAELAR